MNELSLSQEYMMCALSDKGKIPAMRFDRVIALAAAAVAELLADDIIELDGKKLSTARQLPQDKEFLRLVYDHIKAKEPINFKSVVDRYSVSFTGKNPNALFEAVCESLADAGCVKKAARGIDGSRTAYIPDADALDCIIQNIRAEILEDGRLSEDIAALTALLDKTDDIKKFFSAYERKALKKRLKEIKSDPENEKTAKVINYIDELMTIMIVSAT